MRISFLLVLVLLGCAGCRATASSDAGVALWFGPGSAAYLASQDVAEDSVRAVFDSLSFTTRSAGRELVGTSPAEREYFTLLGDREKFREVRVSLTPLSDGRTRIDASAELLEGPVGNVHKRRTDPDEEWLEDFQRAVRKALLERVPPDA
jgi:hypothetical protein